MRVEQRHLLVAMCHIAGVVDVEGDGVRRARIAVAIDIDHSAGHAEHLAQGGCVLPSRHSRLGAQIVASVWQSAAGNLEPRVGAEKVEVVAVLVAAGDSENPGPQNVVNTVRHERRIAWVRDQLRQRIGCAEVPLHRAEQHDTAIGCDPSAIERGLHPLAANLRKPEGCRFWWAI